MTTIDKISQVLSDHARNEINEAEAVRRVHEIACASARVPQMLCLLIEQAKSEIETHREVVRSHVASLALDAQRLVADLEARGPDTVSTTWIAMHVNGLIEAKAKLAAERERLREFEKLIEI